MTNKDQFYCVSCGKLMRHHEADKLFMTGFYRIVYPLGCCTACTKAETDRDQTSRGLHMNGLNEQFDACDTGNVKDRYLVYS